MCGRGRGSCVVVVVFEWVVVVVVGRGCGRLVSLTFRCGLSCRLSFRRRISLLFRLSFRRSLRLNRRRGAQLLASLCTQAWAARGSDLRICTASRLVLLRRVCSRAAWRPAFALALHARMGGARLRLTLSHSVAARTAAACLWLWAVALRPGSFPRSARESGRRAAPTCAGWRVAPTHVGSARLRLTLLHSVAARAAAAHL